MLQEAGAAAIEAPVSKLNWLGGTLYWHVDRGFLVDDKSDPVTCLKVSHLPRLREGDVCRAVFTRELLGLIKGSSILTAIDFRSEDVPFEIEDLGLFWEIVRSCKNLQSFSFPFRSDESEFFVNILIALGKSQVTSVHLGIPADAVFPYDSVRNLLLASPQLVDLGLGGMRIDDDVLCDLAVMAQFHPVLESVSFDRFVPNQKWETSKAIVQRLSPVDRSRYPVIKDAGVRALIHAFNENPRLLQFDLASPCILSDVVFGELRELLLNRLGLPVDLGLEKGFCMTHNLSELEPLYLLALRIETHVRYLREPGPKDPACLLYEKGRLKHHLDTDPAAKDLPDYSRREFDYLLAKSYPTPRLGLYSSGDKRRRIDVGDEAGDGAGPAEPLHPGVAAGGMWGGATAADAAQPGHSFGKEN